MRGKSVKYTRRHFKDVAETLKAITPKSKRMAQAKIWIAKFAGDNPRFDEGRFLDACGL
jgi:hypothetical protein